MPILEAPCPPCKIILNGGFLAALAPLLVASSPFAEIRQAAHTLATVTDAYTKMLATVGVAVDVVEKWEGCDQAQQVYDWSVNDGDAVDVAYKVGLLHVWTAIYRLEITKLLAGEVPS